MMPWPDWIQGTTTQWVIGGVALLLFWVIRKMFSSPAAKTTDHSTHVSGTNNTVNVNHINNLDEDALANKLAAKMKPETTARAIKTDGKGTKLDSGTLPNEGLNAGRGLCLHRAGVLFAARCGF